MKKMCKKLMGMMAALTLALTMLPAVASARTVSMDARTIYMTPGSTTTSISVYSSVSSKVKKSSVKSSNSKVLKVTSLDNDTYKYEYEYFDGRDNYTSTGRSAYISLNALKAGTATVSFKAGSDKYTQKVTVKKYTNPLKTLAISGISGGKNLASKANKTVQVPLKLSKTVKEAVIKVSAKSGWVITGVSGRSQTNGSTYSFSNYTGVSSVTLKAGSMTKNKPYVVSVTMQNKKDKGAITVSYLINTNTPY